MFVIVPYVRTIMSVAMTWVAMYPQRVVEAFKGPHYLPVTGLFRKTYANIYTSQCFHKTRSALLLPVIEALGAVVG